MTATFAAALVVLPGAAHGAAWAIEPTAVPAGLNNSSLLGVSCVSSTLCIGVGAASDFDGNTTNDTMLAEMSVGSGWTLMPVSSPGD